MTDQSSTSETRSPDPPGCVFPWRSVRESQLPKWLAVLLVSGAFALLLGAVRVRLASPTPWAAQKASVIQVMDDSVGRALRLRAREGGPFPSRFDPSEWPGAAAIERAALDAVRWTPPPYVPVLRDLPDEVTPPVRLTAAGQPVLPKRRAPQAPAPVLSGKTRLVPELRPLAGVSAAAFPSELPPFHGVVDATMTAEPKRFLLRVDDGGQVRDCVSLAGGEEAGPSPLETWLRGVVFAAAPAGTTRWISVGVAFTNQPDDGADSQ